MNRTIRILILLFLPLVICGQDTYSKFTYVDTVGLYINEAFEFNDKKYVVGFNRYPTSDSTYLKTTFIGEVNDQGAVVIHTRIDSFSSAEDAVIIDGSSLILAGSYGEKGEMTVLEFDDQFQILRQNSFKYDTLVSIVNTIAYGDYYAVLANVRLSWQEEESLLYWVNKSDLSLDSLMLFDDSYKDNVANRLAVNAQDQLVLFTQRDTAEFEAVFEFTTYDNTMTEVSKWNIGEFNYAFHGDFIILSGGEYLIKIFSTLYCFKPDGTKLWETNLSNEIDFPGLLTLNANEIKEASNGDIIVCGHTEGLDLNDYGYIIGASYRLDKDGNLLWWHNYLDNLDNGSLNYLSFFNSIIENDDGGLNFYGRNFDGNIMIADNPNYIWVVKTDKNGCVLETCENEQILDAEEVLVTEDSSLIIFENPSSGLLKFQLPLNLEIASLVIINNLGEVVYQGEDLGYGTQQISLYSLPSGVYNLIVKDNKNDLHTNRFQLIK